MILSVFHSPNRHSALLPFLLGSTCSSTSAQQERHFYPHGSSFPRHRILDSHRSVLLVCCNSNLSGLLSNMLFCCWLAYPHFHTVLRSQSRDTFPAGSLRRGSSLDGPWLLLLLSLPFSTVFNKIHKTEILLMRQNWTCTKCLNKFQTKITFSTWARGSAPELKDTAPEPTAAWPPSLCS